MSVGMRVKNSCFAGNYFSAMIWRDSDLSAVLFPRLCGCKLMVSTLSIMPAMTDNRFCCMKSRKKYTGK
ncbi:MAG: hypothetical protein WDO16_24135 [Bacteroidota bacterium]